jgi:hypothetical protein
MKTRFAIVCALLCAMISAQQVTVKGGAARVKVVHTTPVTVTLNGEAVAFEGTPPMMVKGRVMVPLRGVFERMGARVGWHPEENSLVTVETADKKIDCWVGRRFAEIDGEQVRLDAAPVLVNGRTLVPLRFIAEALGAEVSWDAPASTVVIVYH